MVKAWSLPPPPHPFPFILLPLPKRPQVGYTSFGQALAGCVAQRWTDGSIGQSTACAARPNLLTVTLAANAPLTTAVQRVEVLHPGEGYAHGRLMVCAACRVWLFFWGGG